MHKISKEQVKTSAINRWPDICTSLAPHLSDMIARGRKHGPCPLCGGKDRARCHNDFAETGGVICGQCGGGADGIATLRWANGWDFKTALTSVAEYLGMTEVRGSNGSHSTKSKVEKFLSTYEGAEPNSLLIRKYFEGRGLNGQVPEQVRVTETEYWNTSGDKPVSEGTYPTMIIPFKRDGETTGLHKTYLQSDGCGKAAVSDQKKTQKAPGIDRLTGSCLELGPDPVEELALSEGVESALAFYQATGIPTWAAASAPMLAGAKIRKDVLSRLKRLFIAADLDKSGAGEKAALKLSQRYACKSREVIIVLPEGPIPEDAKSVDILDVHNQGGEEAVLTLVKKAEPFKKSETKESVELPIGEFGDRELTDHGNSRRFVIQHGREVRYVHSFGKFLIWNGKFWGKDEAGKVYHLATQTALSIYAEAAEHADPKKQGETVRHAKNSQAKSRLEAMTSLAKHQVAVSTDQLDTDQFLLNVQNGTVNLKNGELLAHNPDHLITKVSPATYDPEAKCPIWDRFLLEIMDGNKEMVGFLQRATGYALTGSTSEQCLFLLYGVGRNGKSVFLEVLMSLLGDYGRKAEMKSFLEKKGDGGTNDIAALAGARFVSASEIGRSKSFNESLIKEITGQDRITARFLYQEYFSFTPSFKIFLAANAKPQIKGTDEGIWRRMKLIPFDVVIPKEKVDKHLAEKLRGELPGILKWAVEGCLIWQQKELQEPAVVSNATQGYRRESDHLADFFETICALAEPSGVPKEDFTVPAGILYVAYESYCEGSGLSCVTKRTFGLMMGERGFTAKSKRQNGQISRVYSGLCLKEDLPEGCDEVVDVESM